jgi:prepilin-type N-terminal cleavage/methylation domain-containing protein
MKPIFNRGFTLVEIVVAVAILAFALCSILATYVTCFVLMATSKNINIATNAAMGVMEEIRTAPFTQLDQVGLPCDWVGHYHGCTFNVAGLPLGAGIIAVDNTNPDLLNVTVAVTWNQSGRIMSTTLVTLVANR